MTELRKRMTSQKFASLVSNNCAVMGTSPTEQEHQMYQDLREQDIAEGIPVDIENKGILQRIGDFFFFDIIFGESGD